MKRYIIRKYVMANTLVEALQNEHKVKAEDGYIDDKQPEQTEQLSQIGFDLPVSEYYYSPIMKPKKPRKKGFK